MATRLKALALAISFVTGTAGVPAADILHHHLGTAEHHHGFHIERPGTCLDHQHQCDLGLSVTGATLVPTPTLGPLPRPATLPALPAPSGRRPIASLPALLPDTRAPPLG